MPRSALLGLLLLSPHALARDLPTVAIVGLHEEPRQSDDPTSLADRITELVDATEFFKAWSPSQLSDPLRGREHIAVEDALLGPGRTLLDDGRTLYGQAEFDAALPVLADAVSLLRTGTRTVQSPHDLWDAWVFLGATHMAIGHYHEARDAFRSAVALNPQRAPDPVWFPPNLLERFEQVRREWIGLSSRVTISTSTLVGTISVNGVERGPAPVTLRLAPGESFVEARTSTGRIAHEAILVPEAATLDVELRPTSPHLGVPSSGPRARARQMTSLYRALGRYTGTDLVLLGRLDTDVVQLQLYNPGIDGFSLPVTVPVTHPPIEALHAAIDELTLFVDDRGGFPATSRVPLALSADISANPVLSRLLLDPAPLPTAPPLEEPTRRWKPWMTWVTLGLASAAAAGGAYGLSVALTNPQQGSISVGPIP